MMRVLDEPIAVPDHWPFITARIGEVSLTFRVPAIPSQRGRIHHRYASAMLKASGYNEDLKALRKTDDHDTQAADDLVAKMLLNLEGASGHLLADLWHPAALVLETDRGAFKGPDAALEYGVAVCDEVASSLGLTWRQVSALVAAIVKAAFPTAPDKDEVDDVEVFFGQQPEASP